MQSERLDIRASRDFTGYSRSALQKQIAQGKVYVNGRVILDPNFQVRQTDELRLDETSVNIPSDSVNIPIIYEDANCIVVNKPVRILTHSKGAVFEEITVASWLAERFKSSKTGNRDGIVHRLDRATSGVMILAKTNESRLWLQKQFSTRKVIKTYFALVGGELSPASAVVDMPIERNPKQPQRFRVGSNGKSAITTYETEKTFIQKDKVYSLLKLTPKTGRTHQLRVHLAYLKHPIVGDTFYNGMGAERLYLHAQSLTITLPDKSQKFFESPLPDEFMRPKISL